MKRAKEHRIIWRRDSSRATAAEGKEKREGGGNTLGEKEGENEIFTVEKEENLPWRKSEKQGGGGGKSDMDCWRVSKGERKQKERLGPRQSHEFVFYRDFCIS